MLHEYSDTVNLVNYSQNCSLRLVGHAYEPPFRLHLSEVLVVEICLFAEKIDRAKLRLYHTLELVVVSRTTVVNYPPKNHGSWKTIILVVYASDLDLGLAKLIRLDTGLWKLIIFSWHPCWSKALINLAIVWVFKVHVRCCKYTSSSRLHAAAISLYVCLLTLLVKLCCLTFPLIQLFLTFVVRSVRWPWIIGLNSKICRAWTLRL